MGGCIFAHQRDRYQEAVNQDVAAGQAACKRDPTLAMCNPGQGMAGKFAVVNQGCDHDPSFRLQDSRGYTTGGVSATESDVFVGAWPATICLTSASDPNACGSNTVHIDGPGKKVIATSCGHLRIVLAQ